MFYITYPKLQRSPDLQGNMEEQSQKRRDLPVSNLPLFCTFFL